ncbi:MAG: hypothetical protein J6M01_03090 [Prevotella sp.]|nr:hypothetical protein [Prevotella sp.]
MKQGIVSLFILTVVLMGCTTEAERTQMRAALDSINQLNRSDQPFTAKDVEPYVRFFDRHGSPNDQVLAHYLLGRAYHEQGEAPMALHCYHDAIDCADTTATDCDYAQMARVYAQMAEIFYFQGLYTTQLHLQKEATLLAMKGRDTLAALMAYEMKSLAYIGKGQPDSAINVIEDVTERYAKFGYSSMAATSLGNIIKQLVVEGDLIKAKRYMNIYESESGLFDKDGCISKGREGYYYSKGLLYLKESQLDSAEYWFRKEINEGRDYYNNNAGAYGLAMVYKKRHIPDTVAKYFEYACEMYDSFYNQQVADKVSNIQAMYDYSRHQKTAQDALHRTNYLRNLLVLTIGLLIVLSLLAYIIMRRMKLKRKETLAKYKISLILIEQAQYDIARLNNLEAVNESLIAEKEKIIETQDAEIRKYQQLGCPVNRSKFR